MKIFIIAALTMASFSAFALSTSQVACGPSNKDWCNKTRCEKFSGTWEDTGTPTDSFGICKFGSEAASIKFKTEYRMSK